MDMNTKLMRIFLVSCMLLQACTNATSPRMQCNEKCAEKTNTCYLKQTLVVNAQAQASNSPPATQYTVTNPDVLSEKEPNDTFKSAASSDSGIAPANVTDSYRIDASLSSGTDRDIFIYIPASFDTQVYFKAQNSVSCKVFVAVTSSGSNSIITNGTAVLGSGNEYQYDLSTSPQILKISSSTVWRYSFNCTGTGGDSYSIQVDPTPNSYAQYLQNQGLYTAPGTVSPLTATVSIQTCESYKNSCYKSCKSKIF